MSWIEAVRPYLDAGQILVTVGAVIVGGVWSRRTIFKKREEAPKIRLVHSVYTSFIDDANRFVRVSLVIENQGQVLIRLDEVDSWLYQVAPWPEDILSEEKMIEKELGHYKWPGVPGMTSRMIRPQNVEIEPNEVQEFHFDYVFPRYVQIIVAYSYVNNPTKAIGIGWNTSTIHDMVGLEGKNGK